jgi:hypothetical protein
MVWRSYGVSHIKYGGSLRYGLGQARYFLYSWIRVSKVTDKGL